MTGLSGQQKEALVRLLVEGLKKGDPAMVRGCMERGCDPLVRVQDGNAGPYHAGMHWAMVHFNEKCADEIFKDGNSVNAKDSKGETPVFTAIRQNNAAAVEYLMKKGANPIAQNNDGVVASDVAINNARADTTYYRDQRDRMLKALTGPVVREQLAVTPDFDAAAAKDVKVMKTITLQKPDEDPDDAAPSGGKGPGFKL